MPTLTSRVAIAMLLAGCLASAGAAQAASEAILYSFKGGTDGANPNAGLVALNGAYYGTTSTGGVYGLGVVFKLSSSGTETILHSFGKPQKDGATPLSALINYYGTLYGTTLDGGDYGYGTVYSIDPTGTYKVLHSFGQNADGRNPSALLTIIKHTLYGTTQSGGANGFGTVFMMSPDGRESVLHSFQNSTSDGQVPTNEMIAVKGVLYGTTTGGGVEDEGVIYSITTSGAETIVHSFNLLVDPVYLPSSALVYFKGALYGASGENFCGSIYKSSLSGAITQVVALFTTNYGCDAVTPPIAVGNVLYGATVKGGDGTGTECENGFTRCGMTYSLTTDGTLTTTHTFGVGTDGYYPESGLIYLNGNFYGTTYDGGANGFGTVFTVTP